MKKFFLVIISLVLAFASLVSGCSCNGEVVLGFTNAFTGGDRTLVGETLVYTVQNKDSFGTEFKKDQSITKEMVDYAYNGTYTLIWEQIASIPKKSQLLEREFTSNLVNPKDDVSYYYKLTSYLDITASYYTVNREEPKPTEQAPDPKNVKDFIKTETYFCFRENSYAPIYTETVAEYSNIYLYEDIVLITFTKYSAYTVYNEKNYQIGIKNGPAEDYSTTIYEYSPRSVIDNAQLLFILRNIDFGQNSSTTLPTISYAYGKSKELYVIERGASQAVYDNPNYTNFDSQNANLLTVNGAPISTSSDKAECKVATKKIGFYVNERTAAGTEQTILIQTEAFPGLAMRATPMQYVQPLSTLNNFKSLGVLDFTLSSITTKTNA